MLQKFHYFHSKKKRKNNIHTIDKFPIYDYLSNRNEISPENLKIFEEKHTKILDIYDFILALVIWILSFCIRSHNLIHPPSVSFDETFFGNFTNYYYKKSYFIDIHPPLGKIILYVGAKINGYKGKCEFIPATEYKKDCGYHLIRQVISFYSSFCPAFSYLALRFFNIQKNFALSGALMIVFEECFIIEGKFILTDGILHTFVAIAIFFIGKLFSIDASSKRCNKYYLIMCIFVSIACSIKQTAWSLLGLCYFIYLLQIFSDSLYKSKGKFKITLFTTCFIQLLKLFLIFLSIYIFIACIHVMLIPNYNNEFSGIICPKCISNYKESKIEWEKCKKVPLIIRVIKLLLNMNKTNMGMCYNEGLPSRWWKWPLMDNQLIHFYNKDGKQIILHLNIFNSCVVFLFVFITIFIIYFSWFESGSNNETMKKTLSSLIFLIGYLISFLPFWLIPRSTYLYHYSIPLLFGIYLVAADINILFQKYPKTAVCLSIFIVFGSITSFIIYMPLTYGWKLDNSKFRKLMLRNQWILDRRNLM